MLALFASRYWRLLGKVHGKALLPGILMAACMASGARAADTPSNMASTDSDALVAVRQAVARAEWSNALLLLEQARGQGLDSADLHNLLGYALRKQDPANVERAIQHYRMALQRNPRHLGALEYLGEAYLMRGDVQSAQRQLETLAILCGAQDCEEHQDLLAAIQQHQAAGQR